MQFFFSDKHRCVVEDLNILKHITMLRNVWLVYDNGILNILLSSRRVLPYIFIVNKIAPFNFHGMEVLIFSSNCEANASEILENTEDIFPRYYSIVDHELMRDLSLEPLSLKSEVCLVLARLFYFSSR